VAEQVLHYVQARINVPVVISGFRSPKEIEWFTRFYKGTYAIEVIYIMADESLRFARTLSRNRSNDLQDHDAFVLRELQQAAMGLSDIEKQFAYNRIENNDSLEAYFQKFEEKFNR
jgi:dephospho-CoA kinase